MNTEILVKLDEEEQSVIGTMGITEDNRLVIEVGGTTLTFNNVHFQAAYNECGVAHRARVQEQRQEQQRQIQEQQRQRAQDRSR